MAVRTLYLNIIDLDTHHQNPVAHVPIYITHSGHTSILTLYVHTSPSYCMYVCVYDLIGCKCVFKCTHAWPCIGMLGVGGSVAMVVGGDRN